MTTPPESKNPLEGLTLELEGTDTLWSPQKDEGQPATPSTQPPENNPKSALPFELSLDEPVVMTAGTTTTDKTPHTPPTPSLEMSLDSEPAAIPLPAVPPSPKAPTPPTTEESSLTISVETPTVAAPPPTPEPVSTTIKTGEAPKSTSTEETEPPDDIFPPKPVAPKEPPPLGNLGKKKAAFADGEISSDDNDEDKYEDEDEEYEDEDEDSDADTSGRQRFLSPVVIMVIFVGVVVLGASNWIYFSLFGTSAATLAHIEAAPVIKNLKSEKIINKEKKKAKPKEEITWKGENGFSGNFVTAEILSDYDEIRTLVLTIVTAEPAPLPPEAIVRGEKRGPWVVKYEFRSDVTPISQEENGTFSAIGPAKAIIDDNGERKRISVESRLSGVLDIENEKISIDFAATTGYETEESKEAFKVIRRDDGRFKVHLSGSITAPVYERKTVEIKKEPSPKSKK